MNTSIKSLAINYGLYLGGGLSLIAIIGYAVSLDLFVKWWLNLILFIVIVTVGIISVSKSRKALNGFISFKDAFSSFFITVAISVIVYAVIIIVIFNFVDSEAAVLLQEKTIDAQVEMMRNFNAPEEAIEQALEAAEKQGNMFSVGTQLKNNVIGLVFYAIIGIIVGLIMKKSDPKLE